jgi:hypothetical protein
MNCIHILTADFCYGDLLRALLSFLWSSRINFDFYDPSIILVIDLIWSAELVAVGGERRLALISVVLILFKHGLLGSLLPITSHRAVTVNITVTSVPGKKPRMGRLF